MKNSNRRHLSCSTVLSVLEQEAVQSYLQAKDIWSPSIWLRDLIRQAVNTGASEGLCKPFPVLGGKP